MPDNSSRVRSASGRRGQRRREVMESKSPTKSLHNSPLICCECVAHAFRRPLVRTVSLAATLVLLVSAVLLTVCGAFSAGSQSVGFFVGGVVCMLGALFLLVSYLWLSRRRSRSPFSSLTKVPGDKSGISTISCQDYYNQVPPGRKSDYPMGPHLVMTLPRPTRARVRQEFHDNVPGLKSVPSTPISFTKRDRTRHKNLPPLASAETLSPSLQSSYGSIDSVV